MLGQRSGRKVTAEVGGSARRAKAGPPPVRIVVLMGVAGSGKTTIGRHLAAELGWRFFDGDDFHSRENIAKMRAGTPLTDRDRAVWLAALAELIQMQIARAAPAVIACSALKQVYRDRLAQGRPEVVFVYLKASDALLRRRLDERKGHFLASGLLASQLETLEEPCDAVTVDAAQAPPAIVDQVKRALAWSPV